MRRFGGLSAAFLILITFLSIFWDFWRGEEFSVLIWDLRLPRLAAAIAVGMGLSISGLALQAVFGNPLADPQLLGVASGAALGTVLGETFGMSAVMGGLSVGAVVGAAAFTGILVFVSRLRAWSSTQILLFGVMLNFIGAGAVQIWMGWVDPSRSTLALGQLLGSFQRSQAPTAYYGLALVLILLAALFKEVRFLDAIVWGEESARALGLDVVGSKRRILVVTALLVSICVSLCGIIGFIGLIAPNLVRRRVGVSHFRVIPLVALFGAGLSAFADLVAMRSADPQELPVGAVMTLIGAPWFVRTLLSRRSGMSG